MPLEWSKADEKGLARFVIADEAKRLLAVSQNTPGHTPSSPEDRRELLRAIYTAFLRKEIKYSLESYHPAAAIQRIRSAEEVIESPGEGTCLDLSLVFSAVCLAHELLPILVILQGHVFVIVSLEHGLREWNEPSRTLENELFAADVVRDRDKIQNFIDTGRYIAIECTGFAKTKSLSNEFPEGMERNDEGFLSFERAVAAGREHFAIPARQFRLALDIQIAHYSWRIDPLTRAPVQPQHFPSRKVNLESLVRDELDRKDQVRAFELPLKSIPNVPYIFLICGEESHGPHYLKTRLRQKELPRILSERGFDPKFLQDNDRLILAITWKDLSEDNYDRTIWKFLNTATKNEEKNDSIKYLKSAAFPLVIETELNLQSDLGLTEYFKRDDQIQKIKYFFKFWEEEWHPLGIRRPVIILLYLRYRIKRSFATRWMAERTLKKEIENLKSNIPASLLNVGFKDVPELSNITSQHAEEFAELRDLGEIFDDPGLTVLSIIDDLSMEKGVALMTFLEKLVEYRSKQDRDKRSTVS